MTARFPTTHRIALGDARELAGVEDASLHLVVTSPPYWNLKRYPGAEGQLGAVGDYPAFLDHLDRVWRRCLDALVPGGRLCVVVGDVCLSRRRHGRHQVIPIHADLSVRCRALGFDYLTPILWYKIANMATEMQRPGYFLGRPFEPNAIVKNDVEYILLFRKPGGYRRPTEAQRAASRLTRTEHAAWFRSFWTDVGGAASRDHPAPYPEEIAYRLVRMFSFAGDTVLDPFAGTGTTTLAAMRADRHSLGYEIEPDYLPTIESRLARCLDPARHQLILSRGADGRGAPRARVTDPPARR